MPARLDSLCTRPEEWCSQLPRNARPALGGKILNQLNLISSFVVDEKESDRAGLELEVVYNAGLNTSRGS